MCPNISTTYGQQEINKNEKQIKKLMLDMKCSKGSRSLPMAASLVDFGLEFNQPCQL